jgi:hypothetical protein
MRVFVWDRVGLGFELHCRHWRTGQLVDVGLIELHVEIGVTYIVNVTDRRQSHRPRATVSWVHNVELLLVLTFAQVDLELRLTSQRETLTLRDILSQLSLLIGASRLILAPSMAESVYALIAGIIFINPVLAAHRRVVVTTDLAQPVESGAEPGADFGRCAQAFLHGILDLCQPLVDRDVLTVVASANSLVDQQLSACLLPL